MSIVVSSLTSALLRAPITAPGSLRSADSGSESNGSDAEVIDVVGSVFGENELSDLATAGVILVASIAIGGLVRTVVSRVLDNGPTDSLLGDLIGRVIGYLIVAFGVVYAFDSLGIAIGPLLGALGVIGIALAFALQSLLENFVAGVLLQVRRPFTRGDEVQTLSYEGQVLSIDARTLTMQTPDGEIVRLPNAEVIKNPIVNLTTVGRRRTTVEVGVAYGSDVRHAADVARQAVAAVDGVLKAPAPLAEAIRFGPSSIDIALRFWHEPTIAEEWRIRHDVVATVSAALGEAGITIPFPQRTVHLAEELAEELASEIDQLDDQPG